MAELFHFPSRNERAWQAIESTLRDYVRKAGAGDAMADWILGDLKPRFEACQGELDIEVPTEAAPKVAKLVKFTRERLIAAVGQMIFLEIELYAAKFAEQEHCDSPMKGRYDD